MRLAATTRRRVIEYSGGTFTFGVDTLSAVSDTIADLVATNTALLETSSRPVQGVAPILRRRKPGEPGGGGGGGGGGLRLSEEERDLIGFFGERIAFDWLKSRYGHSRVVDLSCWKSNYRRHVAGSSGDDTLGYDFAIENGGTSWYFEVKATKGEEAHGRHMIELGSSEIAFAEHCRAERRSRYRVLYVLDALHPDKARIFPLPNPRSATGAVFYADPMSGEVRRSWARRAGHPNRFRDND